MTKRNQAEAAKYLLRLRDAHDSFLGFVKLLYPDWKLPGFQIELIEALDALEKGTLGTNNLLITMPPRHAKSTFGTVLSLATSWPVAQTATSCRAPTIVN